MSKNSEGKVEDVWRTIVEENQQINKLFYNPLKPLNAEAQRAHEDWEALKKEIIGYREKPNSSYKKAVLLFSISSIGLLLTLKAEITGGAIGVANNNETMTAILGVTLIVSSLVLFFRRH